MKYKLIRESFIYSVNTKLFGKLEIESSVKLDNDGDCYQLLYNYLHRKTDAIGGNGRSIVLHNKYSYDVISISDKKIVNEVLKHMEKVNDVLYYVNDKTKIENLLHIIVDSECEI